MTGSIVERRYRDRNGWSKACRILGELALVPIVAYAAFIISGNLWIEFYELATGKMMFCENGYPDKCGIQVMLASTPQFVLLIVAGFYFVSRPISESQTILRDIGVRIVPAVTILSAVFTALWLLPEHLRYLPWHLLGIALAAAALLLVMAGWRRLWATTR